jgi:hypothetical protein
MRPAAAVLVFAVAFLAACNGADTMTKQDLIARGDAACQKREKRFAEIQAKPPTSAQDAEDQTAKLIAASEQELSVLKDLKAPDDLQPKLDRYIAAKEEAVGFLEEGLEAAKEENEQAFGEARAKTGKDQVKRLKLAREVGFKECSRPTRPGAAEGGR